MQLFATVRTQSCLATLLAAFLVLFLNTDHHEVY